MKILSNPILEKNAQSGQLERLEKSGVQGFATASAYGCGRNPVDMQKLQQTGQTCQFMTVSVKGDLR